MTIDMSALSDPVFIAKVVDFVVFVVALVWLWRRYGVGLLSAAQEAQNKIVSDAEAAREAAIGRARAAETALDGAQADANRMVDFGSKQAMRLIADERAEAEDHARRIAAHANGELERERNRVRRELLEETVEKAHGQARTIVAAELDAARQRSLVDRVMTDLERAHA